MSDAAIVELLNNLGLAAVAILYLLFVLKPLVARSIATLGAPPRCECRSCKNFEPMEPE